MKSNPKADGKPEPLSALAPAPRFGGWLRYAYLLCENLWLRIALGFAYCRLGLRQFSAQELIFGFQLRNPRRSRWCRNAFNLKKLFRFCHRFHIGGGDAEPPNDKVERPET
jgi:hypothetical protein